MFAKLMKYVFQWESKRNNEKKLVPAQWQSLRTGPLISEYSRQPTMMGRKGKLSAKRLIIFVFYLQKLTVCHQAMCLRKAQNLTIRLKDGMHWRL